MIRFTASEYQDDGSIRPAAYAFAGSVADGWEVMREDRVHLRLGPGYRALRVSHCGVCSTDLARHHLPLPLPQVTGHEAVAFADDSDRLHVVEINASHEARGLGAGAGCAFCRRGLGTHCPERLVLGINGLPGGFSPWLLAPVGAVVPLPSAVTPLTAALVEPFAAALHAVETIAPADGERVAVLGPRRLGALVVAALAAWRRRTGRRYEVIAVARRAEMRALALALGADDALDAARAAAEKDLADVVVETTGIPDGLALAIRLARREVHVKSTTGLPALGLVHPTELVVDELVLEPYAAGPAPETAVLLGDAVPPRIARDLRARGATVVTGDDAAALADGLATLPLGGADLAVVTSLAGVDAVVRPRRGVERALVRPRGRIAVADVGQPRDDLLAALLGKRLRLSTSRCGAFAPALDLLADPAGGLGERLGERMVTDRVPAARLADAFALAASPRAVKVIVTHPGGVLVAEGRRVSAAPGRPPVPRG